MAAATTPGTWAVTQVPPPGAATRAAVPATTERARVSGSLGARSQPAHGRMGMPEFEAWRPRHTCPRRAAAARRGGARPPTQASLSAAPTGWEQPSAEHSNERRHPQPQRHRFAAPELRRRGGGARLLAGRMLPAPLHPVAARYRGVSAPSSAVSISGAVKSIFDRRCAPGRARRAKCRKTDLELPSLCPMPPLAGVRRPPLVAKSGRHFSPLRRSGATGRASRSRRAKGAHPRGTPRLAALGGGSRDGCAKKAN